MEMAAMKNIQELQQPLHAPQANNADLLYFHELALALSNLYQDQNPGERFLSSGWNFYIFSQNNHHVQNSQRRCSKCFIWQVRINVPVGPVCWIEVFELTRHIFKPFLQFFFKTSTTHVGYCMTDLSSVYHKCFWMQSLNTPNNLLTHYTVSGNLHCSWRCCTEIQSRRIKLLFFCLEMTPIYKSPRTTNDPFFG